MEPPGIPGRFTLVQQDGDAPGAGRDFMQNLDHLAQHHIDGACNAGDVATRLGQTFDKPGAHGVRYGYHHDRNRLCRPLRRGRGLAAADHDHFDFLR